MSELNFLLNFAESSDTEHKITCTQKEIDRLFEIRQQILKVLKQDDDKDVKNESQTNT